jgi:small subunit ribosomal protein S6
LPVNTYEGMFVLDSAKVAVNWDESVKHVHDILAKHNAEIVASRQWDERRLAYPVEGHKKGTYLLTFFRTEGENLKEIEADCRLSELVLRDLILKVHPKLVDVTVNQAMTSTPGQEGEDGERREEEDDRPRRRRRDE